MNLRARAVSIVLVASLAVGCATSEGGQQATGAAVGAAAGGLICALAGGNAGACIAAAAGGAALGWGAVKLKQVAERRYALKQTNARPSVLITDYSVQPVLLQPGQPITTTTMYELRTPASVGPRPVTQTFRLLQGDKELTAFTPVQGQMKEHGRYEVSYEIDTPRKMQPGTYQLQQILDAQTIEPEVRTVMFQVAKKTAWSEWPSRLSRRLGAAVERGTDAGRDAPPAAPNAG
jgi:uncharacterized protein YcfJ